MSVANLPHAPQRRPQRCRSRQTLTYNRGHEFPGHHRGRRYAARPRWIGSRATIRRSGHRNRHLSHPPRIHAAPVCAARSCPPLGREACVADRLDEQLDNNVREWLANPTLNRFDPSRAEAKVSPIFNWYR